MLTNRRKDQCFSNFFIVMRGRVHLKLFSPKKRGNTVCLEKKLSCCWVLMHFGLKFYCWVLMHFVPKLTVSYWNKYHISICILILIYVKSGLVISAKINTKLSSQILPREKQRKELIFIFRMSFKVSIHW